MQRFSPSPLPGLHADQPGVGSTRLHGRWLVLARIVWLALVSFVLVLFVISLSGYVIHLSTRRNNILYVPWQQASPASAQAFQHLGISLGVYAPFAVVLSMAIVLVWVVVGAVIFWRRSDDWMALLTAFGLIAWGTTFLSGTFHPDNFAGQFALQWLGFLRNAALVLFVFLFPSGRFVPGWTRWYAMLGIATIVAQFFFPASPFNDYNWPPPLDSLSLITPYLIIVGAQIYRYQRVSNGREREQTKWVVFALAIVFLGVAGYVVVEGLLKLHLPALLAAFLYPFVRILMPVLVPVSIGIAILSSRLWDIDIIINRTLVYGVLTLSTVALYVLIVVGLGALLQAQGNLGLALLATGLVAVLFQPLRTRLQRAVNHLIYGERDDPYRVISRLGQRLESTLAPEAVLPTIVETVAQALKLPYAAITLQQGEEILAAAAYGSARGELMHLPLVSQSEQVGELVLAPRAPGERFSPADRALLEDLARQAGVAAHAVQLTADLKRFTVDLQHERERLVTAREEERRRLRRDLHDGLGPQLASLTLKLETARNRLAHDPLADTLLSELADRAQATVADIRRLVYALRPPALDELGLVSALRELALQHSDQVAMHLDTPSCLPELSAAVEVAAYRIAQEALTNVVRHAAARRCDIRLALDERAGWLSLSIQDDGCGLPQARSVGVGLISMRERAEELGGALRIEPVPTGGTYILAQLPYMRAERADGEGVPPHTWKEE